MMAYDKKQNYMENFVNKVERVHKSSVIKLFRKEIINLNTLLTYKVRLISVIYDESGRFTYIQQQISET